ncbi:MAG: ABC transporter ATP-binding protein [Lachnospiraceae bacterium]|nr:ABC transporter ATP-binding protein [Lachnospiraceae bacterium]
MNNLEHSTDLEKRNVISVKNLNLCYGDNGNGVMALENINLEINEGDFVCVLGPSGCGKSTFLKILAGFLFPTSGKATLDGKEIKKPDSSRGVVFQTPNLYPWMNIEKNVTYGPRMRKVPKEIIRQLSDQYLRQVGLSEFKKQKTYELSGGMKQRAALAKVLVNDPRIILMDEPFGALDALTRVNMQGLIRKIWKETGKTILLITHDVDEALQLGNRVIVFSKRPGTILKEFDVDFAERIQKKGDENEIIFESDYLDIKQKILEIINKQHDEIAEQALRIE